MDSREVTAQLWTALVVCGGVKIRKTSWAAPREAFHGIKVKPLLRFATATLNRRRLNFFLKTPAMGLSFAGIVTTFHIETVYEKRQDLAQRRQHPPYRAPAGRGPENGWMRGN
jgi:hypothetical protein